MMGINSFKKPMALGIFLCTLISSYSSQGYTQIESEFGRPGGEAGSGGGEAGSGALEGMEFSKQDGGFYGSCASAIAELRQALDMLKYQNGNFAKARQILVNGLSNALKQIPPHEKPLTKSALQRGLVLNQQFANGCKNITNPISKAQCLDLELRAAVFFLGKFYSYVMHTVYPLDRDFWIPYRVNYYSHCHSYDCLPFYWDFYTAYKDSAKELLNLYIGNGHGGLPDAFAMDTYELRVAENIFKWAASDLNLDLFRRDFSCVIADLSMAGRNLADFNAGSTMMFYNSERAVNYARDVTNRSLMTLDNCGHGYK